MGSPASQTRRERVSVYWTGWPRAQSDPTSGLYHTVFHVGNCDLGGSPGRAVYHDKGNPDYPDNHTKNRAHISRFLVAKTTSRPGWVISYGPRRGYD